MPRKRKGYIAAPACGGSLAGARNVPVFNAKQLHLDPGSVIKSLKSSGEVDYLICGALSLCPACQQEDSVSLFLESSQAPESQLLTPMVKLLSPKVCKFFYGEPSFLCRCDHAAAHGWMQETSGHAAHYRENMFQIEIEKQLFGLKPMNCPGEVGLGMRSSADEEA
eukprot:1158067-Pelagomonas_calceolata.AAC.12